MGTELVQLVTEIDTRAVSQGAARMKGDYQAAVAGMDSATKGAQGGIDGIGSKMSGVGKLAQVAGKTMAAGIGAATAAAAASERSWIQLGTSILGAFAAGGPVAGAIALAGAGIGLLISKQQEATRSAMALGDAIVKSAQASEKAYIDAGAAAERAMHKESENIAARIKELREQAKLIGDGGGPAPETHKEIMDRRWALIERAKQLEAGNTQQGLLQADKLREEATQLGNIAALMREVYQLKTSIERSDSGKDAPMAILEYRRAKSDLDDLKKKLEAARGAFASAHAVSGDSLTKQADALQAQEDHRRALDANDLAREAAGLERERTNRLREFNGEKANELAIEGEIADIELHLQALLRPRTDEEEKLKESLLQQLEGKRAILDVTKKINVAEADRSLKRQLDLMGAITDEQKRQVELAQKIEDLRRSGASSPLIEQYARLFNRQPMIDFAKGIADQLSGSLTDAIVDGIENGFRNAKDIALQTVHQLLSQVLKSVISSGIDAAFAGLFSGGGTSSGGLGGILNLGAGLFGGFGGGGGGGGASPVADIAPAVGEADC